MRVKCKKCDNDEFFLESCIDHDDGNYTINIEYHCCVCGDCIDEMKSVDLVKVHRPDF